MSRAAAVVLAGMIPVVAAGSVHGQPAGEATPEPAPEPVVGIAAETGGTPVLTLEECLHAALEGNAALESVRLRRRELHGQEWQAASTGIPSLDLSGTWSRSRDPSFLLDESFASLEGDSLQIDSTAASFFGSFDPANLEAQSFWRASIGSDWEINPFRLINALQGIDLAFEQLDADIEATEQQVIEETLSAYYEVALHEERVAAVEADLAARQEFLDLTRRRFQLELGTALDTLQAAVSLANRRPDLRRAHTDLRNASSRLNLLMGRDALTPIALFPVNAVERNPVDADAAAKRALRRPDLRSRELGIRILEKKRGVYRADQRPSLSLDGRYGWVARSFDDLAEGKYDYWTANVTLSLPLFNGFETRGRVMETEGSIAREESDLRDARQQARLEVVTAVEELEAARENLDAAELNVDAAEQAWRQMSLRYELGKADRLAVLEAQSDRFLARSNLISARYDVLAQTAALKRAVGLDPRTPLSRLAEMPEGTTP